MIKLRRVAFIALVYVIQLQLFGEFAAEAVLEVLDPDPKSVGELPANETIDAVRILAPDDEARAYQIAAENSVGVEDQDFEELFYNQTLDHFNEHIKLRYQQRYLLSEKFWGITGGLSETCKGPILLYTGNEGDIEDFWAGNGFMKEVLAPRFGALLLFIEARYYGKSMPFGNESLTSANIGWLSTGQILEDIVELTTWLKESLDATDCPVIAFGGSYGATLTTYLRAHHPDVVIGGLAASAPFGYYDHDMWPEYGVTAYTWENTVQTVYAEAKDGCLNAIMETIDIINGMPKDVLQEAFQTCTTEQLGKQPSGLFVYYLENIPQINYPYAVDPLPAWPVTSTCEALLDASQMPDKSLAMVQAAAAMTVNFFQVDGQCIEGQDGVDNVPGDGPELSAWGYQSCKETLHQFSARTFRTYNFNITEINAKCYELWGVVPVTSFLADTYGGYNLAYDSPDVTNLIWSNGLLDPWHGGGMLIPGLNQKNTWIKMSQAAHHLDLRGPHPSDPAEVTNARVFEADIIEGWIQEAMASKL